MNRGYIVALAMVLALMGPWAWAGDEHGHEMDMSGSDGSMKKDATHDVAHKEDADDADMSKKSFKKHQDEDPVTVGGMGHVRRASVELRSSPVEVSAATGKVAGGTMVHVEREQGDWVKVMVQDGPSGWMERDDLRKKPPVMWKSNRHEITYQECLGKECKGKHADDVHKHTELLEVDRGGPDNAFLYVKLPHDVYGWVPVAYMMEWKHKFKED